MSRKLLGRVMAGAGLGAASLLISAPATAMADDARWHESNKGHIYTEPKGVKPGHKFKIFLKCEHQVDKPWVSSKVTGKLWLKPVEEKDERRAPERPREPENGGQPDDEGRPDNGGQPSPPNGGQPSPPNGGQPPLSPNGGQPPLSPNGGQPPLPGGAQPGLPDGGQPLGGEGGQAAYGEDGYGDEGHGEDAYGDKGHRDQGYGDKSHGEDGYGDKGHRDQGYGDKSHGDEGYGDKGHRDEGYGDKGHGEKAEYWAWAKVPWKIKPGHYEATGSCGKGKIVVLPKGGVSGGDGGAGTDQTRTLAGAGMLGAAAVGGFLMIRRRRTDGSPA